MKILTMVSNAVPEFMGGELRVALDLSKGYRDAGHECDILTYGKRTENMQSEWKLEGMNVRKMKTPSDHADKQYLSIRTMFTAGSQAKELSGIFSRYDAVHVHNIHSVSLARDIVKARRASGKRVIWTAHDYWFCCPKMTLMDDKGQLCNDYDCFNKCYSGSNWLKKRSVGRKSHTKALGELDLIVAPSNYMRKRLENYGYPKDKIITIYNGIPDINYDPNIKRSGKDLVFLGAPMPHKGIGVLLEAMKILNDRGSELKLHILGDVSGYPEVPTTIKTKGLDNVVQVHGFTSDADKENWLAKAAVLILPSAWPENCSIVLLEGLRAGIPIITSGMGGNPELILNNINGIVVDNLNHVSLTESIEEIVKGENYGIAGENRMRYLEIFSLRRMVDSYIKILNNEKLNG